MMENKEISSGSDESEMNTPLEIKQEKDTETAITSLSDKSRQQYELAYMNFMEWRSKENVESFSENVLLAYFIELATKYKASSLWTRYSMLRSTLNAKFGVNIEHFARLRAFLKRKSAKHTAKKSKTFSPEQINKFIAEAPDEKYLPIKVALIMGIMGACRAIELYSMQVKDIQDLGSAFAVIIPNERKKISRKFTITGNFYDICRKYLDLRPKNISEKALFLQFHKGKYIGQRIGINKFGMMGKAIAKFLKLPDTGLYTGHCFRRSSATLLVDTAGGIVGVKPRSGWRTLGITETRLDSTGNEKDAENKFFCTIEPQLSTDATSTSTATNTNTCNSSTSTNTVTYIKPAKDETITLSASTTTVHITNCSNFTINIITKNNDEETVN